MYFPYLRGRQFELIALREMIEKGFLSKTIIPIIEPVKGSPTLVKAIQAFTSCGRRVGIVVNPGVGSLIKDFLKEQNQTIKEKLHVLLADQNVIRFYRIDSKMAGYIKGVYGEKPQFNSFATICNSPDEIQYYEDFFRNNPPRYNLIPDESVYRRRIRENRVLFEDRFEKQKRNVDYSDIDDEPFSSDHLFYIDDGYVGFSDYSIIGNEYSDTGFAPYAVAIHIVYFDKDKNLRVHHFVSKTNDDITDPAGKFEEAVEQLVKWNETKGLKTFGMQSFERAYRDRKYPGLGTVKKFSLMHHLELMGTFFNEVKQKQ